MKLFRKRFLTISVSFSSFLMGCHVVSDPRMAYIAVDIATELGSFIIDNFKNGKIPAALESMFDSLFSDVSDTLSDETKGAIIENVEDPTGLTGRKAFDVKFVVKKHREAEFKTETILVKKEDITFVRASRDSTSEWKMTEFSNNLISTRLNTAAVQISLKSYNINPGRVDGIWGDRTKEAIGEFQSKQGLPLTKELDEETKKILLNY